MRHRILIVSRDVAGVSAALKVLIDAGYEADGAGTFDDATRLLATDRTDLLITDQRLGAYNGLHLIIRGQAADPNMSAIVTTPTTDSVVEAEAKQFRAEYMVRPLDAEEWLRQLARILEQRSLAS